MSKYGKIKLVRWMAVFHLLLMAVIITVGLVHPYKFKMKGGTKMRKSKRFLVLASVAFIFLFGIVAVHAGAVVDFTQKLKTSSGWTEMREYIKTNTSNEGYVKVTNMGGTSSLGFRARGKWYDGSVWHWTNFGPTTNVTTANATYIVYYMQSMSASMPINLSVRNNTSNSSTPTVTGTWQYDR